VGVALRDGHPVYFVIFFPEPEPGQSVLDVCAAEARFVHKVHELHPESAKPAVVGNCQGGWAAMMLAASHPDDTGAIVISGAPMSYWGGAWRDGEGDNTMRYAGGLLGGTWLASLASDLGNGKFDGAYLVQNFENLNPANSLWKKYYQLFANIDTEPQRFLDFERWWGGYFLLGREEIEWITKNLFVGNKLWSDADGSHAVVHELNEDGFRVIAVAFRDMPDDHAPFGVADEADLVLLGYVAFLDPPKDSAAAAIGALREHGIAVKVLTGDNDIVTRRICSQVGLKVERVVLGSEIDALAEDELAELAEHTTVFARLSPQQKARIIQALRSRGHAVGFLGDGINDGSALKAADVGISVDTAVDVAKESADIILLEKNLRVLGDGVIEGRKVFGNILKYARMGASSNFGNVFSVLGASAFLPFLPMLPVQILLNNLLYDASQTAVATDNVDAAYLKQPRKWEIGGMDASCL
jgi:pimeloyl-ACP methyl ester carboxylesterase